MKLDKELRYLLVTDKDIKKTFNRELYSYFHFPVYIFDFSKCYFEIMTLNS